MIESSVNGIADGLIVIANTINGCRVLQMWTVNNIMQSVGKVNRIKLTCTNKSMRSITKLPYDILNQFFHMHMLTSKKQNLLTKLTVTPKSTSYALKH